MANISHSAGGDIAVNPGPGSADGSADSSSNISFNSVLQSSKYTLLKYLKHSTQTGSYGAREGT